MQWTFVMLLFAFSAILGCSRDSSPNTVTAPANPVKDSRLVGNWNVKSKATLENGHDVTMDNYYSFGSDGTFTNVSRTELLNGDTGKPFYTSTSTERGTWTVDGDKTCWTTPTVELTEFETFTDLITREMIEQELVGGAPPECWTFLSADASNVSLRPSAGGDPITLKRRE